MDLLREYYILENTTCDCTSMSYFVLSIVLLSVGTFITIPALGGVDHYLSSNLGHMWFVGPICICSGMMLGIKSILYLRRKHLIEVFLLRRALQRQTFLAQEPIQRTCNQNLNQSAIMGYTASTLTLPPPYDVIVQSSDNRPEPPPPTYAEAMLLINCDKNTTSSDEAHQ